MSDLVFVADVHLVEGDTEAAPFHRFLRSLAGRVRTCVIVGDLFNVWIARRRFLSRDQARLLDVVRETARLGVTFKYVEGNRDYFVGETWSGDPFAEVAGDRLEERAGPARILASHGDLVNLADRQYRLWRAATRSVATRGLLALLPSGAGRALANGLEARLRGTNMRHKGSLPEPMLRAYASRAFAAGFSHVVLGHFHHETRMELDGGTLWILPDWRAGRRYLRFDAQGTPRFEAFEA